MNLKLRNMVISVATLGGAPQKRSTPEVKDQCQVIPLRRKLAIQKALLAAELVRLLEDPFESPASFPEGSSDARPLSLGWTFLEVLLSVWPLIRPCFCISGSCYIFHCRSDKLCSKTALISVFFSCSFIILSLSALQLFNSTTRLLIVSARFGGVPIALLSSDSSSLLWEPSPISWGVTILCVYKFPWLIVLLGEKTNDGYYSRVKYIL